MKENIKKINILSNKLIRIKIAFFIFSFFVSFIIIYIYHKGLTPIDIITIPILTLIIYFIMQYIADIAGNNNVNRYIEEKFLSHNNIEESSEDLYESLTNKNTEKNLNKFKKYQLFDYNNKENKNNIIQAENYNNIEEINREEVNREEVNHEEINREEVSREEISHEEINREEVNREEISHEEINREEISHEEINREEVSHEEEEILHEESADKNTFKDKKQKQIFRMNKSKKPNINQHLMKAELPKNELTNNSKDSLTPININISYNNNRSLPSEMRRNNNLEKFIFDSGLKQQPPSSHSSQKNACFSEENSTNQTIQNNTLAKLNRPNYSAYLKHNSKKDSDNKFESKDSVKKYDGKKNMFSKNPWSVLKPQYWKSHNPLMNQH